MVVIAEFNKETNQSTGTLYEIRNCPDLTNFNRNFDYKNFYPEVEGRKFYNMKDLTAFVKSLNG